MPPDKTKSLFHPRNEEEAEQWQEYSEGDQLFDTQNVISRFRANLVIAGVEPFEEDNWSHLIIGNTRFVVAGQCGRCQMVGVDQETGTKTKEPLMSLSAYRMGKVTFGVYLTHQLPKGSPAATVLSVGSLVQPEPHGSQSGHLHRHPL